MPARTQTDLAHLAPGRDGRLRRSRLPRRPGTRNFLVGASALTLATGLVAIAPGSSASSSPPAAVTFASIGSIQHYVVPAGVRVLNIVAVGGNGGNASGGEAPQGAALSQFLPVTPGESLVVTVGANGGVGDSPAFGGGGAGAGGGTYPSGSGGGASVVATGSSPASRVLVVAGAGGIPGGGNITDCSGWNLYAANADSYGGPGSPHMVKTAAGVVFPGANSPEPGVGLAAPARGGSAAAAGSGGTIAACTYPDNHVAAGSIAGSAGAGASGGSGGATRTGAGSGGGGGGGYFGGGGGASGDAELPPCADPSKCANTGGEGGAAGSNFLAASTISWEPVLRVPTGVPFVTIAPVIAISAPASGASFPVGQAVRVAWSCSGNLKASGQDVACTAATPSGGPLDTKSPGLHHFSVSDSGIVASVSYAVTPACGKLKAGALGRCLAQSAYFKTLARCGAGEQAAACSKSAKLAYNRSLAKIK